MDTSFDYVCPLCGKMSTYNINEECIERIKADPYELIHGLCDKCHGSWIKYAFVVFGGDPSSLNIGQNQNSNPNSRS